MKKSKRFFAALLSLAMLLALLPIATLAVDEGGDGDDGSSETTTSSGVELSKTATLEDDGTYTIQLEAYATGEVKTTTITTKSGVPCDIVLVLDQSGSMDNDFSGNSTNTTADKRITALKNAATAFVKAVQENAAEYNVDHKIAIVGFASGSSSESSSAWSNTELLSTTNVVSYSDTGISVANYQDALVSANENNALNSRLTTAIDRVEASGATYGNYGLIMAKGVLDNRTETTYTTSDGEKANRKTIVVFFTDGYPGKYGTNGEFYDGKRTSISSSTYNNITVANSTIAEAAKLKAAGVTIYSVGIFDGANPAASYNFTVKSGSSSSSGPGSSSSNYTYYDTGTQAVNAYMHFVSSDYDSSCTSMTSSDRSSVVNNGYYLAAASAADLSKVFENISSNIDKATASTTSTLDGDSVLRDVMETGFDASNAKVTVQTAAYKGSNEWENPVLFAEASVTNEDGVINVTGFSYKDNYVAEAGADLEAQGQKLIVTIKGVLPTDDAVTGAAVYTNTSASGIYADASATTPAAVFPRPQTILTSKSYVLDYAKPIQLSLADVSLDSGKVYGSFAKAEANPRYGSLDANLVYTPNTTKWDGYDSFYVLGTTNDDSITSVNTNDNLWAKINVIPANNVYYEDDFVTSESDGTVGIVYTGEWKVDNETNNGTNSGSAVSQDGNNSVQGWETSLANDTGYSDGSAHVSSTSGATATFTFTGTGVDIYSYTNMTTGTVTANLYTGEEVSKANIVKALVVDNKSVADYYQIPTLSFTNLDYGTYTVKITVTNQAADRTTYYLDGIRVYNPVQEDATVQAAYGEEEINATFTNVRELLQSGAVAFVDEGNDEDGVPTEKSATGDYTDSEIGKIAPENEVYLSKGQSIVLKVTGNSDNTYYLGLKAPQDGTIATVTNGDSKSELNISHTTDLYYKVTPDANGTIVITNTGDNLLSITKLRTTGSNADVATTTLTAEEVVAAVQLFSTRTLVAYSAAPVTDEVLAEEIETEATEAETTEAETTERSEVPETEAANQVTIENPKTTGKTASSSSSWVSVLFNAIKSLFGRH